MTPSLQLPRGALHPLKQISALGNRTVSNPTSCAAVLLKAALVNVCVLLLLRSFLSSFVGSFLQLIAFLPDVRTWLFQFFSIRPFYM